MRPDLIGVRGDLDIRPDQEDVVYLPFDPLGVPPGAVHESAYGVVVPIGGDRTRYAQLLLHLPNGSIHDGLLFAPLEHQWVAAATVGPYGWEGDLARGTLLDEQLVLGVEQEHGEGPVQASSHVVGLELGEGTDRNIFVVDEYARLAHHGSLI